MRIAANAPHAALLVAALLAGCGAAKQPARAFPRAERPVAPVVSPRFSTEPRRDGLNEAREVMDLAGARPGMSVADIGAGEGYYTVRLAARVGPGGRVLAEDIGQATVAALGERVQRERLDNVSIRLGTAADPGLPANGFERVFLVHMYHEVAEPYEFLWRLRPALRPGGRVIVVDADRPTERHGIPPATLTCEFGAVGYRLTRIVRKPEWQAYYAEFEAVGARPAPTAIKPCHVAGGAAPA